MILLLNLLILKFTGAKLGNIPEYHKDKNA